MCLAKAYLQNNSDEPILEDIAHMSVFSDRVELATLFGEGKVVQGKVVEVDFAASEIVLDERRGQRNLS